MHKKVLTGLFLGILCASCSWNNEEDLYGTTAENCSVDTVSYSLNVVPLLDHNCYGCHSTQNAPQLGGNIMLDQYDLLLNYVNSGRFMGSIRHEQGYEAMPKGASKLTTCEIQTLQNWIDNGAANN